MGEIDFLKESLEYCATTGLFRWKRVANGARRVKVGDVAGSVLRKGYVRIKVAGRNYPAHRLAWAVTHGAWPHWQIDHINGDRADNRIENLRDVKPSINSQNRVCSNPKNSTGLLGVSVSRSKYVATIRAAGGGKRYLGTFESAQEAHAAYLAAKALLHPEAVVQRKRADAQQGESTKCGGVCVFHAKNFCVSEPINANQLCGASL